MLCAMCKFAKFSDNVSESGNSFFQFHAFHVFLADRTNSRAYATLLRLSVCNVCSVSKRCFLEQKLLLTAYGESHIRNRLVPK